MRRLLLAALLLVACDKPSKDDCRRALLNMQHLMGTENLLQQGGLDGEVRRCQGGSTTKAVQCAIAATSMDELKRCDFNQVPAKSSGSGSGSSSGSGSGSAK